MHCTSLLVLPSQFAYWMYHIECRQRGDIHFTVLTMTKPSLTSLHPNPNTPLYLLLSTPLPPRSPPCPFPLFSPPFPPLFPFLLLYPPISLSHLPASLLLSSSCRGKNLKDGSVSNGKLHLIDLAGSGMSILFFFRLSREN